MYQNWFNENIDKVKEREAYKGILSPGYPVMLTKNLEKYPNKYNPYHVYKPKDSFNHKSPDVNYVTINTNVRGQRLSIKNDT